jgi:hypothetical protein
VLILENIRTELCLHFNTQKPLHNLLLKLSTAINEVTDIYEEWFRRPLRRSLLRKPKVSLSRSQTPDNRPYTRPKESSPRPHINSAKSSFILLSARCLTRTITCTSPNSTMPWPPHSSLCYASGTKEYQHGIVAAPSLMKIRQLTHTDPILVSAVCSGQTYAHSFLICVQGTNSHSSKPGVSNSKQAVGKSEIQLDIKCHSPSSFRCKCFNVERRNDIKYSLCLILQGSLGVLRNKNTVQTLWISKRSRALESSS